MTLPTNIVGQLGDLYTLDAATNSYHVVEGIPPLKYEGSDSTRFAIIDGASSQDEKLFDMIERVPIKINIEDRYYGEGYNSGDYSDDIDIIRIIDNGDDRYAALLADGRIIHLHEQITGTGEWTANVIHHNSVMMIPHSTGHYVRLDADSIEGIIKHKISLIETSEGIFYIYGSNMGDRILIHSGEDIVDYSCMRTRTNDHGVLRIMIIALLRSGQIMYTYSYGRWDEHPQFDDWRPLLNVNPITVMEPEKSRIVEIGCHRLLVDDIGRVASIDRYYQLILDIIGHYPYPIRVEEPTLIDIPLRCFNPRSSRMVKSSKRVEG